MSACTVINRFSDVQIHATGDFRIMTRRVNWRVAADLNESHGFLRGPGGLTWVFKQTFIMSRPRTQHAGKGNYNRLTGSFKIGSMAWLVSVPGLCSWCLIAGFVTATLSFFTWGLVCTTKNYRYWFNSRPFHDCIGGEFFRRRPVAWHGLIVNMWADLWRSQTPADVYCGSKGEFLRYKDAGL